MGRASRRKRNRQQVVEEKPTPGKTVLWRRGLPIAGVVAAVLIAVIGVWNLERNSEILMSSSARIPDPDTSAMTPPVARAIREARQQAIVQRESATAVGRFCQMLHAHWQHDAAAACYEIARELAPDEFRWVYLLAGIEDIRGADGERIDWLFSEALHLAPRFPPAYVRRADALLRLGRWSEARDSYQTAVELDPDLVLAHRGLGQATILLGDGQAAVGHLERAAALAPEDRITHIALARAYTLAGNGDGAAQATRRAQSLSLQSSLPDPIFFEVQQLAVDPETLRERISSSMGKGDYDTAIEALILLEESEGDGARQQLAAASKQRANRLAFSGEFDAALAEFERAAHLAPTDPELEHNWGTVLLRRGDLEQAVPHFEKAIQLNPQSADSLYNLGVVLEGLGQTYEAIQRFTAAAVIDPDHVAATRLAELGVVAEP